jgi:hypothetical protein
VNTPFFTLTKHYFQTTHRTLPHLVAKNNRGNTKLILSRFEPANEWWASPTGVGDEADFRIKVP